MKTLTTLFCILSVVVCGLAADQAKPKLKVAADGLPNGHDTPEGVACDFARAFIKRDASLFTNTCVRLYGGGKGPTDYAEFLKSTVESMKAEATQKDGPPSGPKSIGKVFAARYLSKNGPASYGYAAYGFQEVMFVDVGVFLHNGKQELNRTLVIKDKDGKWYVHPMPDVSPLLSAGLHDEGASKQDFTDAYEIPNGPSFKLHILKESFDQLRLGYKGAQSWARLEKIDLNSSAFVITDSDIESYNWSTQSIRLTKDASSKFKGTFSGDTLSVYLDHRAFVVTLDGERLYGGLFLRVGSAMGIDYPVIYIEANHQNHILLLVRPSHQFGKLDQARLQNIAVKGVHDLFSKQGKLGE